MRTIRQRYNKDCGVAALAMLAGVSYDEAFMYLEANAKTARISSGYLVRGLKYFKCKPRTTRCQTYKKGIKLDSDALLSVSTTMRRNRPNHWVVWDSKHQIKRDPWVCDDGSELDHVVCSYLLVDRP